MRACRLGEGYLLYIYMQCFIILANIGTEEYTIVFYLTQNSDKVNGVRNVGQGYQV